MKRRSGAAMDMPKFDGLVVGEFAAIGARGEYLVGFPGCLSNEAVPARSLVSLSPSDVGLAVALMFEAGDATRPIVMGVVRETAPVEVGVDGERFVVTAKREIVLRVGEASITLTKEGKILLRGAFVSSRASGVNRIQGGSVQIN